MSRGGEYIRQSARVNVYSPNTTVLRDHFDDRVRESYLQLVRITGPDKQLPWSPAAEVQIEAPDAESLRDWHALRAAEIDRWLQIQAEAAAYVDDAPDAAGEADEGAR